MLPRRPHLSGGAVRRQRRGLCPVVLGGTAADRGNLRDAPTTDGPGARLQSARRRGRLPVSSRAAPPQAESTLRPARRASRRRAAPPASQPGPKSSRKSTKLALTRATRRCWSLLFLKRRREQRRSFPRRRAGRRILCFFLFLLDQRYPLSQRKSNFLFLRFLRSMGRQCATPCFLTLAHDPSCQKPRECGSGT